MIKLKDFPNHYIDKNGNVINILRNKILSPSITKKGYLRVHIMHNKKEAHFFIHRLLALAYIENPLNKPFINHIDGNKLNNVLSNLEWCTNSENIKHAYDNGLIKSSKGIPKNRKKLTL
jgi:hypothetical protein